jgi:hypothetical protein
VIIYFTNHDYIRFITTAYYYLFYGRHDITVILMKVVLNTIVISLFYDQKGTIISHLSLYSSHVSSMYVLMRIFSLFV